MGDAENVFILVKHALIRGLALLVYQGLFTTEVASPPALQVLSSINRQPPAKSVPQTVLYVLQLHVLNVRLGCLLMERANLPAHQATINTFPRVLPVPMVVEAV